MNAINTKNRGVRGEPAKKSWRVTTGALAVAVLAGGWSLSAQALVLGQIQVSSYLGEQLRAEVPVTQLSSDEMASLTVRLADPNDFSGRGLVYNSAISSIRVVFEPTGNSTAVIRLTSARPIQDPFMDVLMDISWRTGSMQRSYTMLVDPPQTLSLESSTPPQVSVLQTHTSVSSTPSAGTATSPSSGEVVAPAVSSQSSTSSGASVGDDIVIREHVVPASQANSAQHQSTGATQSGSGTPPSRTTQQPAPQSPRQSSGVASPDRMSTKVSPGQTLGQIASAFKPAGVTMEQMLTALYRANPGAFINKNINWVKAGATLVIPSDSEIASISQSEARSMVNAHARAFNQYRQQAALTSASTTGSSAQPTAGGQTTGGEVTPQPNGQSTSTQSQDHLSITSTGSQANQDTQLAAQQQANEATTRHADISSNINDLRAAQDALNGAGETGSTTVVSVSETTTVQAQQSPQTQSSAPASLPEGGSAAATDTSSQTTSEGGVTVPAVPDNNQGGNTVTGTEGSTTQPPSLVVDDTQSTATQPDVADGTTDTQTEPSTAVDQPATETPQQAQEPTDVPPPVVMPTQQDHSTSSMSFIDQMMENPLIPIGGLAVIALIAFGGVIIVRRRRAGANDENVGDEEEAGPSMIDSFFADNISQQGSADASMLDQSSSLYAASQLDTNADVDPIQEADVYLAYGRDEQAAEILRDALSSDPNRVALSAKLCEVYARQGKINLFDEQAARLHALTSGRGAEWVKIAKLGRNISPSNSLFADAVGASSTAQSQNAGGFAPQFSAQASSGAQTDGFNASQVDAPMAPLMSSQGEIAGSNVDGDSALSLDLPEEPTSNADAPDSVSEDDEGPATRLALAEEFLAIGNKNDAREIVQEVLAEAPSAEIKARAQSLLDQTK